MPDTYRDVASLARSMREGFDFRRESRRVGSGVAHIAVHGGGIEPGTGEAADAVAAAVGQDYYAFVGLRALDNAGLHITSTHFDDPQCLDLLGACRYTISYHGCAGSSPVIHLGGRDGALKRRIGDALAEAGFVVDWHTSEDLDGSHPRNVCNRNASGAGVQLEMSAALRHSFFPDRRTSRSVRESGRRTPVFHRFVAALASVAAGLSRGSEG